MQRIWLPENLKANCVLFLDGSVNGTTAYDLSWNWNNGTLVNSPTTQRTQGYKGFVFNGSNQYITAPAVTWTSAFSAVAIVKSTNTSNSRCMISASASSAPWQFYLTVNNGVPIFSVKNTSGSGGDATWPTITTWTSLMMVWTWDWTTNTNGVKLYCNRVLTWQTTFSGTAKTPLLTYLWAWWYTNPVDYFAWSWTILMIFNKALSQIEIDELYYSFFIP